MIDTSTATFEPIAASRADTCRTQCAVAEHNSVYDTLKKGKRVRYAPKNPACSCGDAPDPKPKPEAKTS